ncbi:MAG: DUF4974 domain-containing protein [Cytophagales bacterium]|nr:DUF4974 domain-containing protein [Cytophagales bacterium]
MELTVLTGKVNLSSTTNALGIDVLPQEKVIYKSSGEFEKLSTNQQEIAAITRSTDYNMQFTNDTMSDVIERIESNFNVSIRLLDKNIRSCRITVDFTDQSLENSMQLISEVLNVTYSIEGNAVK